MLHDLGLDENGSVANPFRQDWRGPGARAHAGAYAKETVAERRAQAWADAEEMLHKPAEDYAALPPSGQQAQRAAHMRQLTGSFAAQADKLSERGRLRGLSGSHCKSFSGGGFCMAGVAL